MIDMLKKCDTHIIRKSTLDFKLNFANDLFRILRGVDAGDSPEHKGVC